jgi:hypothetical protein
MSNFIPESIFDYICSIIDFKSDNYSNMITKKFFLKEYKTLQFRSTRRSGHTTLALRLMQKYENTILITPLSNSLFFNPKVDENGYSSIYGVYFHVNNNWKNRCFSAERIAQNKIQIINKNVILDPASMLSNSFIESLYDFEPNSIIMLG